MIISASRRTDIPSFYSDWFLRRIQEGFVLVRNPMNARQVSEVSLSPDVVDGIVLWTKNPIPLLDRLYELDRYPYYFQFTLNPYESDVEPNLPSKWDILIPAFQRLSDRIGPDRIMWRYDPILQNDRYSIRYHAECFERMARRLGDYTRKCTISFIDNYRCTANALKRLNLIEWTEMDKHAIAKTFSEIARGYGLEMDSCAEAIELSEYGITHARCIDDRLFSKITGTVLSVGKDKSQRLECGCVRSVDIGQYNTCGNGCKYCYANHSAATVEKNLREHDRTSPLLCGWIADGDVITRRKMT